MSILLNGGSNPYRVIYNGTYLSQVFYNGVKVWEDYPTTLKTDFTYKLDDVLVFSAPSLVRVKKYDGSGVRPHIAADYKGQVTGSLSTARFYKTTKVSTNQSGVGAYTTRSYSGLPGLMGIQSISGLVIPIKIGSWSDDFVFTANFEYEHSTTNDRSHNFWLVGNPSDYSSMPFDNWRIVAESYEINTTATFKLT